MNPARPEPSLPNARPPRAWGWRHILCLVLGVFLIRAAYLVWVCPYELAADEAHYWDWSRRPDLSYYSKGPGVAWTIAASVRLLGIHEGAVRLPAAVAGLASALLLAILAWRASGRDARAGFLAAAIFLLAPVFHGASQFMTIDGPFFACWIAAALTAWSLYEHPRKPALFLVLGSLLGIGMLYKYTLLLLVPGLVLFLIRHAPCSRRRLAVGLGLMFVGMAIFSSPIFIWNHLHGWPTVAHLIGHTGLPGGDIAPSSGWNYNPLWTLGYVVYPFIFLGPPLGLLLWLTLKDGLLPGPAPEGHGRMLTRFATYTGAPIFAFYLLLSFRTDIEMNWAVAGFTVPMAAVAVFLARHLPQSPRVRRLWSWAIGVGLVCALLISFGKWPILALSKVRVMGRPLDATRLLARVEGHRDIARNAERAAQELRRETGQEPFYVAYGYSRASLLAFYISGHPSVCSASSLMGGRESSYDYFPDTDLADPDRLGRPAILVGNLQWVWDRTLYFEAIQRSRFLGRIYYAYNYGGPSREPHMK
jgi:undecaprenyl-diphosphatase